MPPADFCLVLAKIMLENPHTFLVKTGSEYICRYDDGREILPDYVTHKFNKILAKSDLPKIRFHDLRHSAASLLINAGFNLKEVQEWLGHSDVATTGNIYSHLQYSSKINMANRFNDMLSK
ncbi:MAG: site-specific integrase, partial [Oscillospiraceae bacterium]|nr:site-specific integrase [Oscillospiraceae bacterium]